MGERRREKRRGGGAVSLITSKMLRDDDVFATRTVIGTTHGGLMQETSRMERMMLALTFAVKMESLLKRSGSGSSTAVDSVTTTERQRIGGLTASTSDDQTGHGYAAWLLGRCLHSSGGELVRGLSMESRCRGLCLKRVSY